MAPRLRTRSRMASSSVCFAMLQILGIYVEVPRFCNMLSERSSPFSRTGSKFELTRQLYTFDTQMLEVFDKRR